MAKPITNLADLRPDPKNARRHTPRNVGMIERALGDVGAARSIVVDEDGVVLAGNATIEAAAAAGIERVQVVDADGQTLIAVRRAGLTPEQKAHLALYDNRTAELAEWDVEALAELGEAIDLSQFWTRDELAELLTDGLAKPGAGGDDFDITPQDGPTRVRPNEIWSLGEHRLLCGDSTKREDVERLMGGKRAALLATDPPYNVGIYYGKQTDDRKVLEEYECFSRAWFAAWQNVSDRQIVTPGYNNLWTWMRAFDKPYHVAPWTKTNAMTRGHVARFSCFEPVLFYGRPWKRERANDVFDYPVSAQTLKTGETLTDLHPCPKPVGLWVDLLENYSERDERVADAFGGSGTMVVAAERMKRQGFVMELSPEYCDVILRRWEAETGRVAERVDG